MELRIEDNQKKTRRERVDALIAKPAIFALVIFCFGILAQIYSQLFKLSTTDKEHAFDDPEAFTKLFTVITFGVATATPLFAIVRESLGAFFDQIKALAKQVSNAKNKAIFYSTAGIVFLLYSIGVAYAGQLTKDKNEASKIAADFATAFIATTAFKGITWLLGVPFDITLGAQFFAGMGTSTAVDNWRASAAAVPNDNPGINVNLINPLITAAVTYGAVLTAGIVGLFGLKPAVDWAQNKFSTWWHGDRNERQPLLQASDATVQHSEPNENATQQGTVVQLEDKDGNEGYSQNTDQSGTGPQQ